MASNISKIGLVNLHTYLYEELDVSENIDILVLKADNGVGKTSFMTSLYPTILSMDLNKSLNFGKTPTSRTGGRTATSFVKGQSYIFMKIFHEGSPMTLVLSFRKDSKGKVNSQALVFSGHEISLWEQNKVVDVSELKRRYLSEKLYTFNTQRAYMSWVATELFGVSVQKLESVIRVGYRLASKDTLKEFASKSGDEMLKEIRAGFISIADKPNISDNISDYAKNVTDYYLYQKDIENKTAILTYLAKQRDLISRENRKVVNRVDSECKKMIGSVNNLKQKVDDLEIELENYKSSLQQEAEQLEIKTAELEVLESAVQDYLVAINSTNLGVKIESKEKELGYLIKESQSLQSRINTESDKLSRLSKKESDLLSKKESLQQDLKSLCSSELPFNPTDWGSIEQEYKEYEAILNRKRDLQQKKDRLVSDKSYLEDELSALEDLLVEELYAYDNSVSEYISQFELVKEDSEVLEEYQTRLQADLNSRLVNNQINLQVTTDALNNLTDVLKLNCSSNELEKHYKAQGAIPFYEVVDFKETVSKEDRERVEAYLRGSGLLEALVKADKVDKGFSFV